MAAKPPVHVTVTGAAGQIGYSLLFRIASGQLLGPDQPVVLRLLEIEPGMKALEGVVMEIDDCAFPLVSDIVTTTDLDTAFAGTSWALLVGSIPRKAGMERGDLLTVNGGIFGPQGRAIAANAASDVRVLVVGNPCNTNCLIARSNAPEVPSDRWFAMTRLDENRAKSQLAHRAGVPVAAVTDMAIWGNHSATQFPDYAHALIGGKPAVEVIGDLGWLRGEFITTVQKRGASIIDARGLSSAASAANAAIDSVVSIRTGKPNCSPSGTPYSPWETTASEVMPEAREPVRINGSGGWSVVEGLAHDEFATQRIRITTEELESERADVADLLP